MNCKPGDLAIIVGANGTPSILGHIVKVLGEWKSNVDRSFEVSVVWEVAYPDGSLILATYTNESTRLLKTRPFNDCFLRPLRDTDGQDETITWAGKPER